MGGSDDLAIPQNLAAAARVEGRQPWLTALPGTIRRLATRWSLDVGPPFQPGGQTAWVAPAARDGDDLVIKVLWRHPDAEQEAEGLGFWDGDGAVRLYAVETVDDETIALLLERCRPATPLKELPELEQDLVIARLLRRLWRPLSPGHRFRSLHSMCDQWAAGFEEKGAGRGTLDPGLAREGIAIFRELPGNAEEQVLLCTDLHAENVLASEREPWLAVDPKPYAGDPTYDALQHMLNCEVRLHADPRGLVRRMADLLELDADRLQLWLFARCVQESPDWPALAKVARQLAPA